jgi:hypothetical protein
LTLVFVFDGALLLCAPVLLGLAALPAVPELLGADTRVSVLAAVPPCGFTDWDAAVPPPMPVPLPAFGLAGATTFWFAFVFWLVFAFVLTFVLVLEGEYVLLYTGALCCGTAHPAAAAQTAAAIRVKDFLFMAALLEKYGATCRYRAREVT